MENSKGKIKETMPVDEVIDITEKNTIDDVMEKVNTTESPVKPDREGTVICQNLNVRKAPAKGSTVLKIIPKDTKVKILSDANDAWYKVSVDDIKNGFCMKEFIKVSE